jgi:uncharacterized protein (DUF1684 family)
MKSTTRVLRALALLLVGIPLGSAADNGSDFAAESAAWRKWRLERLTSETSWLTLVGLAWLEPGESRIGSAPGSEVALPAKAPARVGVLRLADGRVTLVPAAGGGLTVGGAPVEAPIELVPDSAEEPTLVELGSINFLVIERSGRLGVRVRDREARLRREFPGLDYFPADPRWRLEARFTPNPPGTTAKVANVLGSLDDVPSPGKLTFDLLGETYTITALDDTGDGRLFVILGDKTNGLETYGAGRYAYTDPPVEGRTILDLNRLYNMPCAFTAFSTCQLPPRENRLPIRVEAGEKKFVDPAKEADSAATAAP